MAVLLELVLLLIFIFIWFRPVLKRQKEVGGYVDKKAKITALLLGLIPATIVLLLCEIGLGWVFKLSGISGHPILNAVLKAFVMYGVIEELTKYAFAKPVLKKYETLKRIDIMVIFGFVGMGYEIAESLFVGSPLAGAVRGIFVAHIMYQFIMGHFFYESIRAQNLGDEARAKRNWIFCLAIPILVHGVNDCVCEVMSVIVEGDPSIAESAMPSANMPKGITITIVICNVVLLLINLSCLIWGLKFAKKDPEVEVTLAWDKKNK